MRVDEALGNIIIIILLAKNINQFLTRYNIILRHEFVLFEYFKHIT